jgi:chromosome segregation ATPase
MATFEDMGDPASPQTTRERNIGLNGLPSQPTGVDDKTRCIPQEDDENEGSMAHIAKLMTPVTSSEKEVVWLECGRLIELERQLFATLVGQTERDRRIAQLTDELGKIRALLEQAETNVAEATKHAALEQRELQAKLDESLLSRDQVVQELERAQSALQKATFLAAEVNERSLRELAEVHAELEARESELAAVRLRLAEAENGWSKSKGEASTWRSGTQAVAGVIDMDVDRVMWRLMERVRVVEAKIASLPGDGKNMEAMECRNEGL